MSQPNELRDASFYKHHLILKFSSKKSDSLIRDRVIYLFIAAAILVNFSGLFNVIMGPDSALYASISKTMVWNHDYVNMYYADQDWLDKPHFPFWMVDIFFNLFGIRTWSYKLPALLFFLLGLWYTYLFAKDLYNKKVALVAVLILSTAQHIVLSNNDVRAEPYLTALIIASVFHFYKASVTKQYSHLILASLFTAFAIMTKGMFALIPIGSAIIGEMIIKGKWKELFHFRWLVALGLIAIFILPEIYCLYSQFDLHPEKIVFGKTHVSGIKFFFWDSQFGRFFNTGPITGKGNPAFYLHTILWAFLPWTFLLLISITVFIRKNFRDRYNHEWFCISTALVSFIFFSASRFQLPHYLNIIFPFFSILVAQYIIGLNDEKILKLVGVLQYSICILFFLCPFFIQFLFDASNMVMIPFMLFWMLIIIFLLVVLRRNNKKMGILYSTLLASFFLNLYLNLIFYPSLIYYQAGSEAAFWINKHDAGVPVYTTQWSSPYIFYLNRPVSYTDTTLQNISDKDFLFYLSDQEAKQLVVKGKNLQVLNTIDNYPITKLNLKFLNSATREKEVKKMDIVRIKQE